MAAGAFCEKHQFFLCVYFAVFDLCYLCLLFVLFILSPFFLLKSKTTVRVVLQYIQQQQQQCRRFRCSFPSKRSCPFSPFRHTSILIHNTCLVCNFHTYQYVFFFHLRSFRRPRCPFRIYQVCVLSPNTLFIFLPALYRSLLQASKRLQPPRSQNLAYYCLHVPSLLT